MMLLGIAMSCLAVGAQAQGNPEDMKRGMELMQKQMALMTPELVQKANALSPEIKKFLMHVALRHERRSDTLTLVQVMQEIMAEHNMIGVAIATDNGPMAADAARRLALHRLPKGGILPYLPMADVEVVLLDNNCMHRAASEALSAVDAPVFDKLCLAVTYA